MYDADISAICASRPERTPTRGSDPSQNVEFQLVAVFTPNPTPVRVTQSVFTNLQNSLTFFLCATELIVTVRCFRQVYPKLHQLTVIASESWEMPACTSSSYGNSARCEVGEETRSPHGHKYPRARYVRSRNSQQALGGLLTPVRLDHRRTMSWVRSSYYVSLSRWTLLHKQDGCSGIPCWP